MRYHLHALRQELPALTDLSLAEVCDLLPSLGFPVDGVEDREHDPILELDVTANRGDAQSHRGLARDLAARLGATLAPLPHAPLVEGEALFPIRLEAEACPIYATAILDLGSAQATPEDAVALLAAMGANAKQLAAVDASNELLHRYGHPTHAFDADTLKGALIVRWGRAGECLVGLDGVERKLTAEDLVIADEAGPVALAGVMGGDATKVTAATRRVLLESAYFDPRVVRRMAHRHGLHTDASHRFGRGADPAMATVARDLLASRLMAWAGARLVGAWTAGVMPAGRSAVVLAEDLLTRIAGEAIPLEEAEAWLVRLGCRVTRVGAGLQAEPPTWRHDLAIPEDLAEEVLRLRGFDRLGSALPPLEGPPQPLDPGYLQRRRVAARLAQVGFFQTVTYGFVNPNEGKGFAQKDDPEGRTLLNPLGQEFSLMRGTLLRSLRDAALTNLARGAQDVRLFEIAPVYRSRPGGPQEEWMLGLLWAGQVGGEDPLTPVRPMVREEGRSHLIGVLEDLGVSPEKLEGLVRDKWAIRPVRASHIDIHRDDQTLDQDADFGWMVELPLAALPPVSERIIPSFQPFSRFPRVERDLSLLVDLAQGYRGLAEAMADALRTCAGPIFQDLRCVDVFRHKSLPAGRQAWLMRMRFQAFDRTLTGEEVDGWVATALEAARAHGAELRA